MTGYDIDKVRADFPILSRRVHDRPLVYLDNGASAQKPQAVLDALALSDSAEYANVHRGLHFLSSLATEKYEAVRGKIARFLGAAHEREIVFTSGTTEGINLAAYAWAAPRIKPGDEIVLSVMEHHSNIVPWHFLRERLGAVLKWVDVDAAGELDPAAVSAAITERTVLVAVTHMSNVLGAVVDVKSICEMARAAGAAVLIDGSQAAVHMPVNVAEIGCDFYAFTGHKLYGPSGSGALYVREARYDEMIPWVGGGDMIKNVAKDNITYAEPPMKFEAGTPAITAIIGLGAAIDYMWSLGMDLVFAHERSLRDYAQERFDGLNWLTVHGSSENKGAIFSFSMEGAHPHDISTVIDRRGIAVRAGHHCAQPLMAHLGVTATTRASFGLYNTTDEIDALFDGLARCRELLA